MSGVRFHTIVLRPAWVLIALAVVALLLAYLIHTVLQDPGPEELPTAAPAAQLETGYPVPALSLPDLEGRQIILEDLRGRPVLLYFWASWCPFCREKMPALQRLYEEYAQEHDLVLLAVNIMEDPATVRAFAEELQLTYPILLDRDGQAATDYLVRVTPTFFFIDTDGRLRTKLMGEPTPGTVEVQLQELLPAPGERQTS